MNGAALLQVAATALLNGGFAWLTGSLLTRFWLAPDHARLLQSSYRADSAAVLVCVGGGAGVLWASAALMSGSSLAAALPMWWPVAHATDYGRATLLAMAFALLAALPLIARRAPGLSAAGLLGFALSRASLSHGAEGGLATAGYAIDTVHLLLVGVWTGCVALAAWRVLPAARRHGTALNGYLDALSRAAALALAGIVATGVWNSWQRLAAPADLLDHPYGLLLSLKLGLFGMAVLLGAWNRVAGFPRARGGSSERALLVLRIESIVLAGVLITAAALVAMQPPAA
jgi:putative copper resistance protein D